jgi:hypothetical protein
MTTILSYSLSALAAETMGLIHALFAYDSEVEGKVSGHKDTNWQFQNLLIIFRSLLSI